MTNSIFPPSTLILGPAGTGKTFSLATALRAGLEVRLLATEPAAPTRVLTACKQLGISDKGFHWQFVSPSSAKWDSLKEVARVAGTMSADAISKSFSSGIARDQTQRWSDFLEAVANFTSARDGTVFGDATEWDDGVMFAIDNLTGMSIMARNQTVGHKPSPSPGEWNIMQGLVEGVTRKICSDSQCFFTLISHVERESNEITGTQTITASTLGSKLAPKMPGMFTNVIYAKKVITSPGKPPQFLWSTLENGVDTKNGDLPLASDLEPDFKQIVDVHAARMQSAAA